MFCLKITYKMTFFLLIIFPLNIHLIKLFFLGKKGLALYLEFFFRAILEKMLAEVAKPFEIQPFNQKMV